jgi:hypothetical protein
VTHFGGKSFHQQKDGKDLNSSSTSATDLNYCVEKYKWDAVAEWI